MAVPQRARSWLATFAFVTTLALGSPCVTYTAAARDVKRTQLTDATPSFADQPAQPPETVVNAVLNAWRLTGIDPALLLTIAWTENRFRAEAKIRHLRQRGYCSLQSRRGWKTSRPLAESMA